MPPRGKRQRSPAKGVATRSSAASYYSNIATTTPKTKGKKKKPEPSNTILDRLFLQDADDSAGESGSVSAAKEEQVDAPLGTVSVRESTPSVRASAVNVSDGIDEKSLVSWYEYVPAQSPGKKRSPLWANLLLIDIDATLKNARPYINTRGGDIHNVEYIPKNWGGIQKLFLASKKCDLKPHGLCKICFEKPDVPLEEGVVALTRSRSVKTTTLTGNFEIHLQRRSKKGCELHEECLATAKALRPAQPASSATRPTTRSAGMQLQQKIYEFINDANIPMTNVLNPALFDLLDFVASNGNRVKPSEWKLGFVRYKTVQALSFSYTVSTIKRLIDNTRAWFKRVTRNPVKFIYVVHDIWEGKGNSFVGLCVFFVSPLLQELVAIPIGILRSLGQKPEDVEAATIEALERVGSGEKDLRKPIKDATESALRDGRLIQGSSSKENEGPCGMHSIELALNHACGFLIRKIDNSIIDSFPESEMFRLKLRMYAKVFSDKSLFEKYKSVAKAWGYDVIELSLPNTTRIAGTFLMYQTILQSRSALITFMEKMQEDGMDFPWMLNDDDWQQLAEFCSIFEKTCGLPINLRDDLPGVLAIEKLHLANCLIKLSGANSLNRKPYQIDYTKVTFTVINVEDRSTMWQPTQAFKELPKIKMCLPLPDGTDNDNRTFGKGQEILPKMTKISSLLVMRLLQNLKEHMSEMAEEEWVCMFLNPFSVTFGIKFLDMVGFCMGEEACRHDCMMLVLTILKRDFRYIPRSDREAEHAKNLANDPEDEKKPAAIPKTEASDDEDDIDDIFVAMKEEHTADRHGFKSISRVSDGARRFGEDGSAKEQDDKLTEEMTSYYDVICQMMRWIKDDWMELLKKFPTPLLTQELNNAERELVNWQKVPYDAVYCSQRFDIIKYWLHEDYGGRFPYLQCLAMTELGQQYTSAFMERVFNKDSWRDEARGQGIHDSTFEMRVLDSENRKFVEKATVALEKVDSKKGTDEKIKVDSAEIAAHLDAFRYPLDRFAEGYEMGKIQYHQTDDTGTAESVYACGRDEENEGDLGNNTELDMDDLVQFFKGQ